MSHNIQFSGNENAWIEDGTVQIYGTKIAETEAETQVEIVGIQLPAAYALILLRFLGDHEDELLDMVNEREPDDADIENGEMGDEDYDEVDGEYTPYG